MAPSGVTAIRLRSLQELIGTVRDWFKAVLPSKAGPAGRRMLFLVFCSFVTDQVISRRPIRVIGAGRLRPHRVPPVCFSGTASASPVWCDGN